MRKMELGGIHMLYNQSLFMNIFCTFWFLNAFLWLLLLFCIILYDRLLMCILEISGMDLFDSQGFAAWLIDRDFADSDHVSYYVSWVKRFLDSASGRLKADNKDRILSFQDALARNERIQDWQRKQAEYA